MNTTRSFVLAALALAVSGCRIEKPATVVPAPARIETFTASAQTVARGGRVTLSWKVADATAIEVREASTGALAVAETTFEGSIDAPVTANALFVLTARGPGGTDARALSVTVISSGATALTLQALPPTIAGGASTTLTWTAPGASSVALTAGAQAIDLKGQRSAGAVTVTPNFDTTYTLTADSLTRTVTVVVQPAVLTLTAPAAVEAGQPVTLRWTAAGADRLVVTSPGRGELETITDLSRIAAGTHVDTAPALPNGGVISYEVAAFKGTATLSKRVEVAVGTGLSIARFDAPAFAASGGGYAVRWQTIAADVVQLELDGQLVYQSASVAEAASGSFAFNVPPNDFALRLIATNARGGQATRLVQVDTVGVPTSATLTANPTSVAAGSPVTLTFASTEARRATIFDSAGQELFSVTGQAAEGGTVTVHPNADTTYTLTTDNQLGGPAQTATAQVTVTGAALTLVQIPATAVVGNPMVVQASQSGATLLGFPHTQILKSTVSNFQDIKATGSPVLELGSNVTTVDLPFTTWLWGARQRGPLTISRAGWIAWGAPSLALATETSLPSADAPAFMIAPFWDNLTLTANSRVYVELVGQAPDRTLIVQWDALQVGTATNTSVTFQVRVTQAGIVSFHYGTMTFQYPSYGFFTAGLQDGQGRDARVVLGAPASNSAVYFFSPVSVVELVAIKGARVGGLVELAGVRTLVTRDVTAVDLPGDLTISELQFRPAEGVAARQYLEVTNFTSTPLDLTGWSLGGANGSSFQFSATPVQPGSLVLGASTDPALNDDAGVGQTWGSLALEPDGGSVSFGIGDGGVTFAYAPVSDAGVALEVDPGPLVGTTGPARSLVTCASPLTYGGLVPAQQGTPGSYRGCFQYGLSTIPSKFVDLTDGGVRVMTGGVDDTVYSITLAATGTDPAPTLFGVRQPALAVSTNGFLRAGTGTTSGGSNRINASTTSNSGTVAVYWNDLIGDASDSEIFWKRFAANEDPATPGAHWVIQWSHFDTYEGDFGSGALDDLNFEVKLFDSGVIEYHFGTMSSVLFDLGYGDPIGAFGTTWLENPAGTFALPINLNQGRIRANSAYRFTPR